MTDVSIGKTIYVSAGLPATNDAAGFEAMAWTQAKGVQQLPQLGTSHSLIDIPDLGTGFTEGKKGPESGRDTTSTYRAVPADAGQAILMTAAAARPGSLSVKIVKGSGTDDGDGPAPVSGDPVQYAQGVCHSYEPVQEDTGTSEGFTVGFRQNKPTVEATEPVA